MQCIYCTIVPEELCTLQHRNTNKYHLFFFKVTPIQKQLFRMQVPMLPQAESGNKSIGFFCDPPQITISIIHLSHASSQAPFCPFVCTTKSDLPEGHLLI